MKVALFIRSYYQHEEVHFHRGRSKLQHTLLRNHFLADMSSFFPGAMCCIYDAFKVGCKFTPIRPIEKNKHTKTIQSRFRSARVHPKRLTETLVIKSDFRYKQTWRLSVVVLSTAKSFR